MKNVFKSEEEGVQALAHSTRRLDYITLAALILEVLLLLAAGTPESHQDDLWWLGPALGVSETGSLKDPPYVGDFASALGTRFFFMQPPIFFYVFGGFIWLFGVSTFTFKCFYWVTLLSSSAGLFAFLRQWKVPTTLALLGVMQYLPLYCESLRPEPLSLLFGFWAAFLMSKGFRGWFYFGAGFLSVLAVMTYPLPVELILPVFGAMLFQQRGKSGILFSPFAGAVFGIAVGLSVCTWLLEGNWGVFVKSMLQTRALRAATMQYAPAEFFRLITQYWEWIFTAPVFVVFLGSFVFTAFKGRRVCDPWFHFGFVIFVLGILGIFLYTANSVRLFLLFASIFSVGVFWRLISPDRHAVLLATALVWMLFRQTLSIAKWMGQEMPLSASLQSITEQAENAAITSKLVAVDGHAARWLFDYQLPRGTRSFAFGVGNPAGSIQAPAFYPEDASWRKKGETWIFSQQSIIANAAAMIPGFDSEVYSPPPKLQMLGFSFNSVPKSPHRFFIVRDP